MSLGWRKASDDIQTIRWRRRGQKIRNRVGGSTRSPQELHGPLRDPGLLHVDIRARLGLADVFGLADQRKRLFRSLGTPVELERFIVRRERMVVVITIVQVRSSPLRVTPDPIFQHVVPYVSPTRVGARWIFPHGFRIHRVWAESH